MLHWNNPKKILSIRLDNMGDVLMTTPAFRAIKETNPSSHITLLTSKTGAEVANYIPEIDDIIQWEAPWMKATQQSISSKEIQSITKKIKKENFDAAIIFTVYSQSPLPAALLCQSAEIPLRLGYCHENPYQLLTHWVPDPEPYKFIRHEVERQLELVKAVGYSTGEKSLSLCVPKTAFKTLSHILRKISFNIHKTWILVHPGASEEIRRYDTYQLVDALCRIGLAYDIQFLITGSKSEKDLCSRIEKQVPNSYSLAGKLTLGELSALISISPLLISNNTGPVHIASATKTPVVVLYAHTNPQHTPWQVENRVLYFDVPCKACTRKVCVQVHRDPIMVMPHDIMKAVSELLPNQAIDKQPKILL